MERDLQSSLGVGECRFNNTFFTDKHNLTPLPPSDFTPLLHNNQLAFSSFNFPLKHDVDPTQLFDFFSKTQQHYQHKLAETSSSSSSFALKRPRFDSYPPQAHSFLSANHVSVSPPVLLKHSNRSQKLSDKTRSLQKLLPSDKKMDIATMLEEAYKYVRYLQAQVRAIESMPLESSFVAQNDCDWACFGGGSGLGMLNRQQLLQVLVNSPGAQTMLYSQGFCVYSLEQLLLINKLSQAKLFMKK
ncbi:hypothetical protein ACOSP7_002569 [Xanthoceras sorbifolium]